MTVYYFLGLTITTEDRDNKISYRLEAARRGRVDVRRNRTRVSRLMILERTHLTL